jgi:hypothetical protein
MQTNNTKPWHCGTTHAGQTFEWMPTDSKENFEKLIKDPTHRAYFEKQGWLEPLAITYQINREGFRCEEFVEGEPCMIALGCSYTVGIGLPLKDIWPTLVGTALGLRVYNLAWGGSSIDTCFRLARYWIPRLRPQVVMMLAPPRTRIELSTINGTWPPAEVFMPGSISGLFNSNDIFLKHWFGNEENHYLNQEKNMLAIESIARQNGSRYSAVEADREAACSRDIVGYARDYMHTGPAGHKMIAELLLNKLQ